MSHITFYSLIIMQLIGSKIFCLCSDREADKPA
jgi:hypothetical protein